MKVTYQTWENGICDIHRIKYIAKSDKCENITFRRSWKILNSFTKVTNVPCGR